MPINRLAPTGGQEGYLYNLKSGLDALGHDIEFLPPQQPGLEGNRLLKTLVPPRLMDKRRLRRTLSLPDRHSDPDPGLSRYQSIHFHCTRDMYLCRRFLVGYGGQVILTSHSPCAYHQELLAKLDPSDARRHAEQLQKVAVIDEYAFARADYIVFPCEEAEEPYFNTWPDYREYRRPEKLRYLPTGIQPCQAKIAAGEVRRRYGIPQDAFLVCFVGRHNQIKGYDDLKDLVRPLLDSGRHWVLAAGTEQPLQRLGHERWIEAGWTDDPHSLIAAADVFILPNKQTFFDLVLLEALSLGAPIVASATGGNCYFRQFGCSGIHLYRDNAEAARILADLADCPRQELRQMGEDCRRLFASRFTNAAFAEGYLALMDSLPRPGSDEARPAGVGAQ